MNKENLNLQSEAHNKPEVRSWTPAQSAALNFGGRGLLLSAGAGSGKTATLTEKVCRLVCDEENGIPISEMIIVTFTRAAAAELRERISKKLTEKIKESPTSFLIRQLIDLESAEISTIDSFYLRAIKPHFSALGLPPSFGIADTAAIKVLKEKVMADTLDMFFDRREEDFTALADTLGSSKSEDLINSVLLEIAEKMAAKGLDAEVMAKWASDLQADSSEDFFLSPHGKMLLENTELFALHHLNVYSYYEKKLSSEEGEDVRKAYGAALDSDREFLEKLLGLCQKGTYGEVREHITGHTAADLGSVKRVSELSTAVKDMRNAMKKALSSLAGKYTSDSDTVSEIQRRSAVLCRVAAKVLAEYFTAFENEKKERGVVDYRDLELFAHKIFCNPNGTPTDAAMDFSKNFSCIFIDEYQDTNKIQDEIFAAMACDMKRFMVGDVKQSIYAFRGSEPAVFTAYREKWEELEPEKAEECSEDATYTLFMNENFRSDSTVTDFANLVSAFMFPGTATPFEEGDKLVFSRKTAEGYNETKAEVVLVEKPSKKKGEAEETEESDDGEIHPEAEFVADRIAQMIGREKLGDGSIITASDITILMRSLKKANVYIDALRRRGIAVKNCATDELFEQSEVLLVLSILNAIDNPLRDIYLAGTMKSPVFGFTIDDMIKLLDVRNRSEGAPLWYCVEEYLENGSDKALCAKCAVLCDFLGEFRLKAPGMSASELLSELYDSLSLYSLSDGALANEDTCRRIRANLTRLYEYARSFEDNAYGGLHGFINHVCELMEDEVKTEAVKDGRDAVSIMNVHTSKGLEFPVCFLCECSKGYNRKDITKDVLFDAKIGLAMKLQDPSGLVKCNTPLRSALADKIKTDANYEESRILYVAMTRAVERLIVTMTVSDVEKAKKEALDKFILDSPYRKRNVSSYTELILPAVMGHLYREDSELTHENSDFFTLRTAKLSDMEKGKAILHKVSDEETENNEKTEDTGKIYRERLSFRYPRAHLANIPAKVTVSKLRPSLLDDDEEIIDLDRFLALETDYETDSTASEVANRERLMGNSAGEEKNVQKRRRTPPLPRFLSDTAKIQATDIGTATHVFLQFADFDKLRENGAKKELERLLEKRFLTEQMASIVDLSQIESFRESKLFEALEKSSDIKREFRFNVSLPAADFTKNEELAALLSEEGRTLTVQGVIDLVFTNEKGELILVDYKTDRLTAEEIADRTLAESKLTARHRTQLYYYRLAVEKMYGRNVSKVAVYSLPLGDTVDIL